MATGRSLSQSTMPGDRLEFSDAHSDSVKGDQHLAMTATNEGRHALHTAPEPTPGQGWPCGTMASAPAPATSASSCA
jgi:hypothetical protein